MKNGLLILIIAFLMTLGSPIQNQGFNSFLRLARADETEGAKKATPPGANPSDIADRVDNDQQTKNSTVKKYGRSRLTNDHSEVVADKRKLLLTTGEDKAVDLEFEVASANAISVGNPKFVATTLVKIGDKRQIVFKPLSAGETNVTVRDVNGDIRLIFQVRIAGSDLLRVASEIRDLLRDVEGIDVRVVGSKVFVDGEVITPNDYGRVSAVLGDKSYADTVISLVQLSNKALQAISKRIQEDIHNFGANGVNTRVVNGVIFLEGTVDNIDQANRAVKIADTYLPSVRPNSLIENTRDIQTRPRSPILNFIVVNPPPPKKQEKLVRVTFHFVALSKDYDKLFGFKWQPGFTADPQVTVGTGNTGGAAASGTSFTGTLSSLFPKLQSAQTAGYARVLRTGTVVVRSAQPAQLSETTSFPFSAAGQNGQVNAGDQPISVEFGVTPSILGQSEDIAMDLKMNVMSLVGRAPAGQTRAITDAHHVETKIYVKSGESAAIAGMNFNDIGTDFNKDDPYSGAYTAQNTDPLFSLLRSKSYRKKKSQFVIFVTPQIIENASEGTEDLKKNFRVKVK
jgi:pilus assembly protein CpaC